MALADPLGKPKQLGEVVWKTPCIEVLTEVCRLHRNGLDRAALAAPVFAPVSGQLQPIGVCSVSMDDGLKRRVVSLGYLG